MALYFMLKKGLQYPTHKEVFCLETENACHLEIVTQIPHSLSYHIPWINLCS